MKGPSSDELESECAKEHKHRHLSSSALRRSSSSSDSVEVVDPAEAATGNSGQKPAEPQPADQGWTDVLGSQQLYRKVIVLFLLFLV